MKKLVPLWSSREVFVEVVFTKSGSFFTVSKVEEEFNSHLTIPVTVDPEPIQPHAMPTTDYEPEPNANPDIEHAPAMKPEPEYMPEAIFLEPEPATESDQV